MQPSIFERIDHLMRRPSHALGLGFSLMFVVLALGWVISGDNLDSEWLLMSWLPLISGLFLAGVAARRNPLQKHACIYNSIVFPSLANAALTAESWGPIVAAALHEHPTITFFLLLNVFIWLYHIAIGMVYVVFDLFTHATGPYTERKAASEP